MANEKPETQSFFIPFLKGLAFSVFVLLAVETSLRLFSTEAATDSFRRRILGGDPPLFANPAFLARLKAEFPEFSRVFRDPFSAIRAEPVANQRLEQIDSQESPRSKRVRLVLRPSGRELVDMVYHFDSSGRRSSPAEKGMAKKFLLVMGGSHVFGAHLQLEYTLPQLLENQTGGSYRAYNLGFSGAGPNDYLAILEERGLRPAEKNFFRGIREPRGKVIYVLNAGAMDRLRCTLSCYRDGLEFLLEKPNYTFESGALEFQGTFKERTGIIPGFYKLLNRSRLLRLAGLDWPRIGAGDRERLVAIMEEIRRRIARNLSVEEFILVLDTSEPWAKDFKQKLPRNGWKTLATDKLYYAYEICGDCYKIPIEGHPSAIPNWALAKIIHWSFF